MLININPKTAYCLPGEYVIIRPGYYPHITQLVTFGLETCVGCFLYTDDNHQALAHFDSPYKMEEAFKDILQEFGLNKGVYAFLFGGDPQCAQILIDSTMTSLKKYSITIVLNHLSPVAGSTINVAIKRNSIPLVEKSNVLQVAEYLNQLNSVHLLKPTNNYTYNDRLTLWRHRMNKNPMVPTLPSGIFNACMGGIVGGVAVAATNALGCIPYSFCTPTMGAMAGGFCGSIYEPLTIPSTGPYIKIIY